jgi:hypothetical protein
MGNMLAPFTWYDPPWIQTSTGYRFGDGFGVDYTEVSALNPPIAPTFVDSLFAGMNKLK